MLRGFFRPWGPLTWILNGLAPRHWTVFGALGTEERSLACWSAIKQRRSLGGTRLLEIFDEHPTDEPKSRFFMEAQQLLAERKAEFVQRGGSEAEVTSCYLADIVTAQ